jgi:hypothetical protein
MEQQNFVEWGNSPFSDAVLSAAHEGRLNSGALLDALEKAHAVSRGLEQICKLAQANAVQEQAWQDKGEDDGVQPPIGINTIESLLALGEVAARMIVSDVERVSTWADKYGIREGQQLSTSTVDCLGV